jgi:Family of unknown function (DUF6401)
MAAPQPSVPLSAVGLRLTDEVGQAVLDWVAAGDLSASAVLDQHVAAVRGALARCQPDDAREARLVGQAAGRAARTRDPRAQAARSDASRSNAAGAGATLPYHARRSHAAGPAPAAANCPDVPFADSAWYTDETPPLRLLLHYACGFVEAVVRADWWRGADEPGTADFEAVRLAAVCRLIRRAEAAAALPPDLR